MKIRAEALEGRLQKSDAPLYLLFGREWLLIEESLDLVRSRVQSSAQTEVLRYTVGTGFDWGALRGQSQTLSLFSSQRLIELRIPSGKPGDAGTKALKEFAENPDSETVLVVVTGALERRQQSAAWFRSFEKNGVVVEANGVSAEQLPGWIYQRFQRYGLHADRSVASRLSYYVEGNLLAADQEIRKLAILVTEGEKLTADHLERLISDHARFNVYALIDTCFSGDAVRSQRVLSKLRQESASPALVIWALTRELRTIAAVVRDVAAGGATQAVFKNHQVWSARAKAMSAAIRRHERAQWWRLLGRVALAERQMKGRAPGSDGDAWLEVEKVVLEICGISTGNAATLG